MTRAEAAILASFAADSLALGAHWEYDTQRIAAQLGRVENLLEPTLNTYHAGKKAGAQSHYGDQALLLFRTIIEEGGFVLPLFAERWQEMMATYTGYRDKATRETLANFALGKPPTQSGAATNDFAGAARMAPLLALHGHDAAQLAQAARAQAMMTHGAEVIGEGAEFLAHAAVALIEGAGMEDALRAALGAKSYKALPAEDWLEFALMSRHVPSSEAITRFGQSCAMQGAFCGVVHLVVRNEDEPEKALVENVMGGGDSCARGLAAGMLFGARHGGEWLPERWLNALAVTPIIRTWFATHGK